MHTQATSKGSEPIAVIGTGCRFPGGASSTSKLWELLKAPVDLATEIPEDRFNVDRYYHPDNMHHGTSNVRQSYFLEQDVKRFDASFFGVKPVEALAMDPQQRLLLETVYESLDSAGLSMNQMQGSQTGVFVGNMGVDYADLVGHDLDDFPTYFAPGTARSILSNRISYFFDWHGPSITIDTACSSSLIAVHQAVNSLRSGESKVAVAAGANLVLGPNQYVAESKLKMLSPTGRSRMWDEAADGYARGEGVASVVLKTLSAALADGDHIECLIRETGTNQDGRTKGITMPSPIAQAELIRSTYERAGLDLSRPEDRPQYFEAHGTGTPAGDPVEAEAISTAFFGLNSKYSRAAGERELFVGSIKTVIGHTEGTAGLASLIKVSLALQRGLIPPNLHLNQLNPSVKPFYKDLRVPQKLQAWDVLKSGAPRRASVNSFGFGGANAHAIIEAYDPNSSLSTAISEPAFAPFVFSAATDDALAKMLASYSQFLRSNPSVNLHDLAYTLACRRSTLGRIAVLPASDMNTLLQKLGSSTSTFPRARAISGPPRILGVFTGQGAQWARMGAELVLLSSRARSIFEELEDSLRTLPINDRPSWSLIDELLAPSAESHVNQAELSQPLCTAIQILLVQLLRSAGIHFKCVIGHSSGEIAAAYAAGALSARNAIRIAYYRGFHLHRAHGKDGQKGAMMAAGTSFQDAKELCELEAFTGRLCVAACNSTSSVTISGDVDAIAHASDVFDDEGKFTRKLKVDKAYHSHHMNPCSEPYIQSLRDCGVEATIPSGECAWVSSVFEDDVVNISESLYDTYWAKNMVQPVLFAQALSCALSEHGPFDQAIEVGPHPALKGPGLDIMKEVTGDEISYVGCLHRGKDSAEAFALALGTLWSSLGGESIDLMGYDAFMSGVTAQTVLKELPNYVWNHEHAYYHESRISKALRTDTSPTNELLGIRQPDVSAGELRWRNRISSKEVSWLKHHQVQGEIVFPGAGYVSAVLEAVKQGFQDDAVQIVELKNFKIGQALRLDENSSVDTIISLTNVQRSAESISAHFVFLSQDKQNLVQMVENASGYLHIVLGEPSVDALPQQPESDFQMLKMEDERFYLAVESLGFGYTGPFKGISEIQRKLDVAVGRISVPDLTPGFSKLVFHPAALDCAIQSIILAYCFPGDTRLRSIQLPTGIDSIRFNFALCKDIQTNTQISFRSAVPPADSADISGDVDIISQDGQGTLVQLQGLHTKSLVPPSAEDDLHLFSEFVWKGENVLGRELVLGERQFREESALFTAIERVAFYYLRLLDTTVLRKDRADLPEHFLSLFNYIDHVFDRAEKGKLPHLRRAWVDDTHQQILDLINSYPDSIDLQLMHAVGENLPPVIQSNGERNMLEPMIHNNMLNRFYVDALGMARYTEDLTRMLGEISHRFPGMNVLEVGAGTGGATKVILRELDDAFSTYTYTDISAGFFAQAQEVFQAHDAKMIFKTLNIEKGGAEQGYEEYSYDVVIANLVVHATKNLEHTMSNLRRLLRPGGYLILLEICDLDPLRFGFIFGGLPGWWLGKEDGRVLSPCIEVSEWDQLMRKTGFSGVDALTPHDSLCPLSVISTQAVDDRVSFLRQPLSSNTYVLKRNTLTIIGAESDRTASLARNLKQRLESHYIEINIAKTIQELPSSGLPLMGSVVALTDLDRAVFDGMTAEVLKGFQYIFHQSKNVFWVTHGCQGDNPYSNMVIGAGRNIVLEMPHSRFQVVDIESLKDVNPEIVAEMTLRFEFVDMLEQQGKAENLLWYTEPEVRLEGSEVLIPRIRLSKDRNLRYNSARRSLSQELDPRTQPLAVVLRDNTYSVEEDHRPGAAETRIDTIRIFVSYSVLRSVKLSSSDYLFLVMGQDAETGKPVVALTDSQKSIVEVDRDWAIRLSGAIRLQPSSLIILYEELLAQILVSGLPTGTSLVVLDASVSLERALRNRSADRNLSLTCLNTDKSSTDDVRTIHVHPLASRKFIAGKLPCDARRFVNLSRKVDIVSAVTQCLPAHCEHLTLELVTSPAAYLTSTSSIGIECDVPEILKVAWAHFKSETTRGNSAPSLAPSTKTQDVKTIDPHSKCLLQLIDWTQNAALATKVRPIESLVSFRGDRTYWLVGLTGGLGLSLCRWMIDHGARYIAITSRNPKVDPRWLTAAEVSGAVVRIFSNDITSRDAVDSAYHVINTTMPAIVGVVQGAMVLRDAMFADMNLETMETVVKPKVAGSMHLDAIFRDTPLEFFVFLSSIACVAGNPGQSMYAAANMFMTSLANQRRKRGVAGSAAHIGAIMGNGYVTRELTLQQQGFLHDVGNTWMSEQDFFTIIAEAILASPPDSPASCDTVTGLRLQYGKENISWFSNPMFQHLVMRTGSAVSSSAGSKGSVALKEGLQDAKSADEVFELLKDAFLAKLRSSLHADAERDMIDVPLEELGMDSLIAVDVRSWFLKELSIDIPILKILSGGTARTLVEAAQEMLSESILPDLPKPSESAEPAQATGEKQITPPPINTAEHEPKEQCLPQPARPIGTEAPNNSQMPHSRPDEFDRSSSLNAMVIESTAASSVRSVSPSMPPFGDNYDASSENEAASSGTSVSGMTTSPQSPKNLIERTLPMSFGQSRFWFLKSYLEEQAAFNITTLVRINGVLQIDKFANAVKAVGQRHEALRTSFGIEENVPMQTIWATSKLRLERRNIASDEDVESAHEEIKSHAYDLEGAEIMRLQLLSKSSTEHYLVLGYHHINMDGVSFEIFFSDLHKAYEGIPFSQNVIQYPDFSLRERREYETGKWSPELAYWRSEFPDLPEPLPLLSISSRMSRPSGISYGSRTLKRRVDAGLSTTIRDVSRKFKATPFHFYLAVFRALLARYTETEDICIGVADANRKDSDTMESLGLYLNLLPLRSCVTSAQKFNESMKEMQQRFQNAFANSRVPFDVLLNELNVPRSAAYTPLFQVFMNYRQGVQEARSFCGCDCEGELLGGGQIGYDISMDIVDNPGGESLVMLAFQDSLYKTSEAQLLLDDFFALLELFASNPAARLNRPQAHEKVAVDTALTLGRGETYAYTWPATLLDRVEEVATRSPNHIALKDLSGTEMKYGEMLQRVNAIAAAIGPNHHDKVVAVFQDPTPDLICSIMAIWKVGATYVPLDLRLGLPRLALIAQECKPSLILVDSVTQPKLPALDSPALTLLVNAAAVTSSTSVLSQCLPDDTAALLYTSGSTGIPKGIALPHSAFRNNLEVASRQFQIAQGQDVILQQSAFSFDMSLAQTFMTLCNGNTLVVVPKQLRGDAASIANLIATQAVTVTEATPSEYVAWISHGFDSLRQSSLRVVISGGENTTEAMVAALKLLERPGLKAFDAYGPTELTFNSHYREIMYRSGSWASAPLQPLANYSTYIMDHTAMPLPAGASGEVCVGGAAVALGYLHNDALTAERFPIDKFATSHYRSLGWTRMHRTGDRGRITAGGGIVLEGRIAGDTQVKLRGLRVDLRDIESCIVKSGEGIIDHAAVTVRRDHDSGSQFLVAHTTVQQARAPRDLKQFLSDLQARLPLPQYMRPSVMISIEKLPLTSSNKLDRRALESLPLQVSRTSENPELTTTQIEIRNLWREVVPGDVFAHFDVKPSTDFFHVGGSSLLLVNLQGKLKQKYGNTPLLHKLFEFSTLENMAAMMVESRLQATEEIDWEREAEIPATLTDANIEAVALKPATPPRTVILTGATGFLGQQILGRLIADSTIEKVHCLAVRRERTKPLPALLNHEKVAVHHGDLASTNFGLAADTLTVIFSEADSIIHNGADVSFMKTYQSLKRTNVDALKQLVTHSTKHGTTFHFVSSASITQLTGLDEVGESSLSAYPPKVASDGYTAGKWVSERLLEKVNKRFRLPIWIHRPSSIMGEGANDTDLMSNLFKYVELQEAVPQSDSWKGYFDFVSVHAVAASIVKTVMQGQQAFDAAGTSIAWRYVSGEIEYPLHVVKEMSESGSGLPVKTMPMLEWIEGAEKLGMNKMLVAYLRGASETNIALAFPKLVKDGGNVV